jgi:YfiH family protein
MSEHFTGTGGEARREGAAPAIEWASERGLSWLAAQGPQWRLAFSTRLGGVSRGPYESLNLSLSVDDERAAVHENRRRLTAALGLRTDDLVVPGQVHGTRVRVVDDRHRGRGARARTTVIHNTDGLLTLTPQLALVVSTADCVPVFVAADLPDGRQAIALVHAGWRGMLAGVVGRAAATLSGLGRLSAAVVGPSIGPCCFAVGDDVGRALQTRFGDVWRHGRVDLWACAAHELAGAGLAAEAIANPRLCTSCDHRFFSHRRDRGLTGRQAAVAWLTPAAGPAAGALGASGAGRGVQSW